MKISIDIETYSDVDLTKGGVYKYAESPNFEILLFGYSVNDGSVQVVDLARGEKIPDSILQALSDEKVTKWASMLCLKEYACRCISAETILSISDHTASTRTQSVIILIRTAGNAL